MLIQAVVSVSIEKGVTRYYNEIGKGIVEMALIVSVKIALALFIPLTFIPYFFKFWNFEYLNYVVIYISSISFSMLTICQVRNQYQSQPIKYLLASLLKTVPLFCSVLLFVRYLSIGYMSYIYGLLISACIIIVYIANSYSKPLIKISNHDISRVIRYSIPFVPTVLSAWVLTWSNRIFLEKYATEYELGVYSLVVKYASVYFLLFQGLSIYFTPRYYNTLSKRKMLDDAFFEQSIMIVCSFVFVFPVYQIIKLYLDLWLGIPAEDFKYILIVSLLVSFISAATTLGVGLTMNFLEKTKQQMYIYVSIAMLTTLLNYIFISSYGVVGALSVILFSHILIICVSLYYLHQNGIGCKILSLSKYFTLIIIVCIALMGVYSL
ncbi:hypothetical protein VDT1_2505 [Vibrio sp. 16]|nr:hypothetical protein VDT1_2505 [Vibrio sp. 16]